MKTLGKPNLFLGVGCFFWGQIEDALSACAYIVDSWIIFLGIHQPAGTYSPYAKISNVFLLSDILFDRSSYLKFLYNYCLFCYDIFYH
jgi:hypothetical protein